MPVVTLRHFKRCLLLICAAVAIISASACELANAQAPSATARRPLILIPGLLGSRLCRDNPAKPSEPILVWGSASALAKFPSLRITDSGSDDIKPCGVLR